MFTEWFELNKIDANAREQTYAQIPTKFVSHEDSKMWKPRKQRECTMTRNVVNFVKGVQSFEEIRTHNDKEWTQAIFEATL